MLENIREIEASAELFVDQTLKLAIEKIECSDPNYYCQGCEMRNTKTQQWPNSSEMNSRVGLRCVERMMEHWMSEPGMRGWKYCADFIGLEIEGTTEFYTYEVLWSYPTPAYPEPQITVSVFFTLEATRSRHSDCPIDVRYVFEGTRFAHRPAMTFRSKFIYDVLDAKRILFGALKF